MKRKGFHVFIAVGLMVCCSSCLYRAPTDDDICTVPLTNNPRITKDSGNALMPGGL